MVQLFALSDNRRAAARALGAAAALALLGGCAVGPDFLQPAPPKTDAYVPEKVLPDTASTKVEAGQSQHFAVGQDIPGQWWTLFHSKRLDALIAQK